MEAENPAFSYMAVDAVPYRKGRKTDEVKEQVTVEEPLEIRIRRGDTADVKTLSVTMRTPGMDRELTAGFLFTEGFIKSKSDILSIARSEKDPGNRDNTIEVSVPDGIYHAKSEYARNFSMNSSCGVCGKSSINQVFVKGSKIIRDDFTVNASEILALPSRMSEYQKVFSLTGGIHAAGLFDRSGDPVTVAEDVGRHNAVDKVVGSLLLSNRIPASETMLQLSGRAGFEMVQKAVMAGIPIISSVSAPSSLAVETAISFNATLICFVRENRFNIYSRRERILFDF